MIYLFYGPDNFRIRERVRSVYADLARATPDLNFVQLEGNKLDRGELEQTLSAQSLLSTQRLVVIENLLTNKSDQVLIWLRQWLISEAAQEINLILIENELLSSRSPWQTLAKDWQIEAFSALASPEVKKWLQERAQYYGIQLSLPALQQLVTNFGNDLWRLDSEMSKLAVVAVDRLVDLALVNQVVVPALPDNIFRMIDALAHKDWAQANAAANMQLAIGTSEGELLTLIAYQFRNIGWLKALTSAESSAQKLVAQTGLHPYVVTKSLNFSRVFSWAQLQRIFYLLQKIDTAIKLGQTPPRVGLEILVAQVVNC